MSQTSVNSDNKGRQLDSDFKIKTSLEAVQDFSVNPFKDYENYNEKEVIEDQEQNLGLIKSKIKEAKVPHLFQTRPLKEAMEQVNKFTELHNEAKARLHEKQMEMVSEELKTLRSKPEISKYSRQIMQNKKYVPLYKRTDEILSKKEAKLTEERKKMEEQKDAMEKKGLNGFVHHQLPEAIINLKQGAGRLIRDETDRGVLMLCDPRVISKPYGKRIWQSMPSFTRTRDLTVVSAFFTAIAPSVADSSDAADGVISKA